MDYNQPYTITSMANILLKLIWKSNENILNNDSTLVPSNNVLEGIAKDFIWCEFSKRLFRDITPTVLGIFDVTELPSIQNHSMWNGIRTILVCGCEGSGMGGGYVK